MLCNRAALQWCGSNGIAYLTKKKHNEMHIHSEAWYGRAGFNESVSSQSLSTHCFLSFYTY